MAYGYFGGGGGREEQRYRRILQWQALMKLSNFISAMIAILIGGPFAWEFLDRQLPFDIIAANTVPPELVRGEQFHVDWTIEPHRGIHCPGYVYRYLRDSEGTMWIIGTTDASFGLIPEQLGKIKVEGSTHVVPKKAALGPAEFYVRSTYICNFTQYLWPLTLIADPIKTTIVK